MRTAKRTANACHGRARAIATRITAKTDSAKTNPGVAVPLIVTQAAWRAFWRDPGKPASRRDDGPAPVQSPAALAKDGADTIATYSQRDGYAGTAKPVPAEGGTSPA